MYRKDNIIYIRKYLQEKKKEPNRLGTDLEKICEDSGTNKSKKGLKQILKSNIFGAALCGILSTFVISGSIIYSIGHRTRSKEPSSVSSVPTGLDTFYIGIDIPSPYNPPLQPLGLIPGRNSHYYMVVMDSNDRLYVLNNGQIVQKGDFSLNENRNDRLESCLYRIGRYGRLVVEGDNILPCGRMLHSFLNSANNYGANLNINWNDKREN